MSGYPVFWKRVPPRWSGEWMCSRFDCYRAPTCRSLLDFLGTLFTYRPPKPGGSLLWRARGSGPMFALWSPGQTAGGKTSLGKGGPSYAGEGEVELVAFPDTIALRGRGRRPCGGMCDNVCAPVCD
ncbi:hypothetical protein H696_00385 [Fonticula alba]|uniref:Uncharacterized protein n=1 Tax=Fonticula alba TaxID=691883 RepID=A0A058ZH47_FONAL|nr:hypothetical protein H696_00385 [Fonticula alba]KCV72807.1 hypothetical protein H696_00385 [Fonticula alba]|eukprot:XP_009492508.1 hypothetical protein H696_00385 [Fonticula alba]